MELEPSTRPFERPSDRRPKLAPPPPVRLIAVADVELTAVAGLERALDAFYVGILKFEREGQGVPIVYRAENARLRFGVAEVPPPREDYRFVGVEVPVLRDVARLLDEAEIEYVRQKGIFAGQVSLQLLDPAGNGIEVFETRRVM